MISQILLNLIFNSRDSILSTLKGRDSQTGRITLEVITTTMPHHSIFQFVSINAPSQNENVVQISIIDNGPGFSMDSLDNLFEPFFTTKSNGHGIGLPSVKKMIQQHNGAIHVSNITTKSDNKNTEQKRNNESGGEGRGAEVSGKEVVTGAVVSLYFPISDKPEAQFDDMVGELVKQGGTTTMKNNSASNDTLPHIWIIDDDTYVSEFIKISLASKGYKVDSFLSHAEVRARMGMIWRKEG